MSFSDPAAFQAAAGTLMGEGFEAPFDAGASHDFGGFTVSETSADAMLRQSFAPLTVSDGQCALEVRSDGPSTIVFSFDQPVSAFGITITSFGNTGMGELRVSDDTGVTFPLLLAQSPPQLAPLNEIFYGLVSRDEPFTRVTFTSTSQNDVMTFDGAVYAMAAVIPEPSGAGLAAIGAGLSIVWGALRRRSKKRLIK